MTTKEKILSAALALFNETNTQAATTNHIAKAMGISPGNLHYHYKNREEIIRLLYRQMRTTMTRSIDALPATITQMDEEFAATSKIQWEYRFFYREMLFLFSRDPELKAEFIRDNAAHKERIIISLHRICDNGDLAIPLEQIFAMLADQLLLTTHFWIAYEETLGLSLSQENLDRLGMQLRAIFRPYLTPKARKALACLEE